MHTFPVWRSARVLSVWVHFGGGLTTQDLLTSFKPSALKSRPYAKE